MTLYVNLLFFGMKGRIFYYLLNSFFSYSLISVVRIYYYLKYEIFTFAHLLMQHSLVLLTFCYFSRTTKIFTICSSCDGESCPHFATQLVA